MSIPRVKRSEMHYTWTVQLFYAWHTRCSHETCKICLSPFISTTLQHGQICQSRTCRGGSRLQSNGDCSLGQPSERGRLYTRQDSHHNTMFEYNKSNHFKPEPIIITPLTWTYEIATETLSEVMKHSVSMLLIHFGVNIETRVAELSYLLGKQFHSLRRIAEYYRLIYLQLLNDNTTIKLNQHDITGIHERRYTHWQDENWDESLNDDTW